MKILLLTDLIGQEIAGIRYRYTPETDAEYSVQSSTSYLKLANNNIIRIPNSDDNEFLQPGPESLTYFRENFDNGSECSPNVNRLVEGQTIIDILFCYDGDEPDYERSAYLKLSNGYYLTERNAAPVGLYVGPMILNEEEFSAEKRRLAKLNIDTRSFS